jgi:hypothetical protein
MRRVALKPWLTPHLITGCIFTLDAIHTQRTDVARRSIGGKGTIS